MAEGQKTLRIAAMADVHYKKVGSQSYQNVFSAVSEVADVLLLCGDLTDYGLPEEAQIVAKELSMVRIPVITVLGNHDYQSNQQDEVKDILIGAGIQVLDGSSVEVQGVGFAGTKGFCGGFGRRTLEPWGEPMIKSFVQEAVDETLKLESALARLRTPRRIAVLHYAPIQATVEGEPPEIFAFLGSSRLEDPINRYGCDAVFHGHAHRGAPQGETRQGIPVYNVSVSLLSATYPDQPPFRLFKVPLETASQPDARVFERAS